jgi:hypothetical protein
VIGLFPACNNLYQHGPGLQLQTLLGVDVGRRAIYWVIAKLHS